MGRLVGQPQITPLSGEAADKVRQWLRVALAAEASGLLQAALASTVEHVSIRKQFGRPIGTFQALRSEEHTSELQSLMRISYAVFCLKKKTQPATHPKHTPNHANSTTTSHKTY